MEEKEVRLIDADALKEWLDEYLSVFKKYDKSEVKGFVEHQPSIETKQIKYFDEDEKVWKIGSVIVDE